MVMKYNIINVINSIFINYNIFSRNRFIMEEVIFFKNYDVIMFYNINIIC